MRAKKTGTVRDVCVVGSRGTCENLEGKDEWYDSLFKKENDVMIVFVFCFFCSFFLSFFCIFSR